MSDVTLTAVITTAVVVVIVTCAVTSICPAFLSACSAPPALHQVAASHLSAES